MTETIHNICEKACDILRGTNDGEDLSPGHLYMVEQAVNGNLTDIGIAKFDELYKQVESKQYTKPWHCGVEHLTKDHEGYIYWKGKHIEHFSHKNYEKEKQAAIKLAEKCRYIESRGIEVNISSVIWHYEQIQQMSDKDLRWWPALRSIYHIWFKPDILHLQLHPTDNFIEFNRKGGITARGKYPKIEMFTTYYNHVEQLGYESVFKTVLIDTPWISLKSLFELYKLTPEQFL